MIPPEIEQYAEDHTTPEPDVLARLNRETHLSQVYPRMLSGPVEGTFLRMICSMLKPRRVLEIGTFTGYSAIFMAMGLPANGILHTIEVNPEQEEIISRYIHEAGLTDKIVLHIGDAMEIIPALNEKWDLVFLDADKPNYLRYYNLLFERLEPGGILLADNALWDGKVLKEKERMDPDTTGIAEFNDFIQKDERVENLLLPVRDGIMVVRKKA
jgi:caffeoyl-CoA O-methyltransferase